MSDMAHCTLSGYQPHSLKTPKAAQTANCKRRLRLAALRREESLEWCIGID